MAVDSKISNLPVLPDALADGDLFVVVDASGLTTNKIAASDVLGGKADLTGASFSGTVSLKDGTSSDLALNFSGDTDTGLYRSSTGAYVFMSDGTNVGSVSSNGITTGKYFASANNNLTASNNPTTSYSTLTLTGTTQIFASGGTIPPSQTAGVIKVTTGGTPVISVGSDCVHDDIGTTLGTAGVYIVSWVSDGTNIHATVTGAMT